MLYPVVPAQITTIPPVSQTKPDVGSVVSPGCSKTIFGFFLSPTASQIAFPNDLAPAIQFFHSGSLVLGIMPQCEKSFLLITPTAPLSKQNCLLFSSETTATGFPPNAATICRAIEPNPPAAPHTRTTSSFSTIFGLHPISCL